MDFLMIFFLVTCCWFCKDKSSIMIIMKAIIVQRKLKERQQPITLTAIIQMDYTTIEQFIDLKHLKKNQCSLVVLC